MIKKKNLKNQILNENKTIRDALKSLEASKYKICLVINNKKKLIGVLTDGDLRRILIKNTSLETKLKDCIKNFIFAKEKYNARKLKFKIKKSNLIGIPVVNNKKQIMGLFINEEQFLKRNKNTVLIFAGGLGKRLRPLTDYNPKPMLNLGNMPILESTIYSLREFGFNNFIIAVNYLSEKIINYFEDGKKHNVNITYIKESKMLGTAGALSKLHLKKIKDDLVLINGDIYSKVNYNKLLEFHKKGGYDFTIGVKEHFEKIKYGLILKKNNRKIIDEKPIKKYLINSGIYVLKPNLLKNLKKNSYIEMNQFINYLNLKKKKIGFFHIYESWFDIGDFRNFEDAKQHFEKNN
tara:strand:- start:101 stop:1150 length:1050 start_codon:yes stop_codon:yes gene_type:complete